MQSSQQVLKQYWGYDQFRPLQEAIIDAVLQRKDTLAILPTGAGKSICFQVPALQLEGLCLVISPLIALMQDQVTQLKARGIRAVAIHSGMSHSQIDVTLDNCVYGDVKFLYLSPERIQTDLFQERVKKMKVGLIAVDEAHCISQWGHDFRPPYLEIASLREWVSAPFIALTASATRLVKEEIQEKLEMKGPAIFQKSFARDNLSFVVRTSENKEKKLLEIVTNVPGSSIVYVRSRKATREWANKLSEHGITSTSYHAGLSHQDRLTRQEEWLLGKKRVIVATNAFGMGIDKPDVRTVIHMDLPENMESYYQEAGRAGRDGRRSFATVLFHTSDALSLKAKAEQSQPTLDYLKKVYQALANYFHVPVNSSAGETFSFDLTDFCKRFQLKTQAVYAAIKKLEEAGLIQLNDGFYRPSRVHFSVDNKELYAFQIKSARYDPLIRSLLRLYGAELFSDFVNVSENQVAKSLNESSDEIRESLRHLHQLQLLHYDPVLDTPQLTYLIPRQDVAYLPIDIKKLNSRRDLYFKKMNGMIEYVEQSSRCRMQLIQEYFDERTDTTCGICDVCIAKKRKISREVLIDYRNQIFHLLKERPRTADDLESAIAPKDRALLAEVIREMVDGNEIQYDQYWALRVTA